MSGITRTVLLLLGITLVVNPRCALAQAEPELDPPAEASEPYDSPSDRVGDVLYGDPEQNDLMKAFNGWQDYYMGYVRSPILFDPRDPDFKRLYPEMAKNKIMSQTNEEKRSLVSYNLGVDKVLRKSSMAMYRPLRSMEQDYYMSNVARDDMLEIYNSVVGVANLTLAYLDKTIAASLATTKSQGAQDAQNQLLKQILWVQSKMADPQNSQLQRDVDEKVEECQAKNWALEPTSGEAEGDASRYDTTKIEDCQAQCGIPETGGTYSWCVCCAEVAPHMNRTTETREGDAEHTNPGYDLWDRVLYGSRRPVDDPNLNVDHVLLVGQAFRTTYGNVQMGPKRKPDGTYPQEGDPEFDVIVSSFDPPAISLPVKISIFRNGIGEDNPLLGDVPCREDYKESDYEVGSTYSLACPFTGMTVEKGIYPAVVEILRKWPPDETDIEDMKKLWTEASLGVVLTARDFKDMFELAGEVPPVADDWEPKGNLRRWLDAFADASAVAAMKRFHLRMVAIADDHMTYNMYATAEEKNQAGSMMQRITDQLNRAELDAEANFKAVSMLTGMYQETDRLRESRYGAAAAANLNHLNNKQQSGNFTTFGNFTKMCAGADCEEGPPDPGAEGPPAP